MKELLNRSLFDLNVYDFKDELKWELRLRVKHLLATVIASPLSLLVI
jgi:hypothetical protein